MHTHTEVRKVLTACAICQSHYIAIIITAPEPGVCGENGLVLFRLPNLPYAWSRGWLEGPWGADNIGKSCTPVHSTGQAGRSVCAQPPDPLDVKDLKVF